jgi:hypothetical protein
VGRTPACAHEFHDTCCFALLLQPLRIVSAIDQQQSSLLLFENPLPQPITLNIVMTPPEHLPSAFGLLNKKSKAITLAPFKELQVRFARARVRACVRACHQLSDS